MKRILLYANWMLLAGSVLVLAVSLLCLTITIVFGEWNSRFTLYWLSFSDHFYDDLMTNIVWVFLIIGALFVVLVGVSRVIGDGWLYSRIGARAVFLAFLAGVVMYGTFSVRFFQMGPFDTWEHLQTVALDDHVYHLLLFAYDKTTIQFYRFYECDKFDLFCEEVYSTSPIGWSTPPTDERILLVTNASDKTISLQVYGEIAYTRHYQ